MCTVISTPSLSLSLLLDLLNVHKIPQVQLYVLYSRKYWRSLNLAVWPKTTFLTPLVDLNLAVYGTVLPYVHARIKKFGDFNLAVLTHTTKPPNLIPRQIFWLYGMIKSMIDPPKHTHPLTDYSRWFLPPLPDWWESSWDLPGHQRPIPHRFHGASTDVPSCHLRSCWYHDRWDLLGG